MNDLSVSHTGPAKPLVTNKKVTNNFPRIAELLVMISAGGEEKIRTSNQGLMSTQGVSRAAPSQRLPRGQSLLDAVLLSLLDFLFASSN